VNYAADYLSDKANTVGTRSLMAITQRRPQLSVVSGHGG
jgi:hypothetical protein